MLVKGEWTADGQYFVYSLSDPDNYNTAFPTYFYSRSSNKIRSVDAALGGSVYKPQFTLSAPSSLEIEINKDGARHHVKVDLATLEQTANRQRRR